MAECSVVVFDADTGHPVNGARIDITQRIRVVDLWPFPPVDQDNSLSGTTDANGLATFSTPLVGDLLSFTVDHIAAVGLQRWEITHQDNVSAVVALYLSHVSPPPGTPPPGSQSPPPYVPPGTTPHADGQPAGIPLALIVLGGAVAGYIAYRAATRRA